MAAKDAPALTPETTIVKIDPTTESSSFFDWFSKRTITSYVPNGVIVGGVAGVVLIIGGILLSKKESVSVPVPAGV